MNELTTQEINRLDAAANWAITHFSVALTEIDFRKEQDLNWLYQAISQSHVENFNPEPKTEIEILRFEMWKSEIEEYIVCKRLNWDGAFRILHRKKYSYRQAQQRIYDRINSIIDFNHRMKNLLTSVFFMMLVISCSQETLRLETYPAEVVPYVIKFKAEAAKRGYNFDFKGLRIILAETVPRTEYEAYYEPTEHTIYIRTTGEWTNWHNRPEELVMHELGHAILKRDHDFTFLPNGAFKSVMGCPCALPTAGWHDGNEYRESYYYDELFNPQTPPPAWSK